MNGTLGLWLAILVLAIAAAYGNVQYFKQQTQMQVNEQKLKTANVTDLADEYGNEDVKKVLVENAKLKEDLDAKVAEVTEQQKQIDDYKNNKERNERTISDNAKVIQNLEKNIKDLKEYGERMKGEAEENLRGASSAKDAESEANRYQKLAEELSAEKEKLQRENGELKTDKETLIASAKGRIQTLQREKHVLLETITQKSDAIRQRKTIGNTDDADGKVLSIDLANKFCVLDLGSINNVRRGMRFEVVRWSMNKWMVLGTVEIQKVNYSTSDAVIIDKPSVIKECPVTGYVARDPEERYSPYAVTKENAAIPLRAINQGDASSMSDSNPIIVGDKIRNPLYERDKKLKFAFAGEPVLSSSSEDILKSRIQASGNIFQDKVDIDTDFLILGRVEAVSDNAVNIDENSEIGQKLKMEREIAEKAQKAMDTAEQYGIPIMREVELNTFLR